MLRFGGKIVLVTGASKGIGATCAKRFAAEGAIVLVNYRSDSTAAQHVVTSILDAGGRAHLAQGSVAETSEADALFQMIANDHGRIDVLINNAGVFKPGNLDAITQSEFDWHFGTNVFGTFLMSKGALPLFPSSGGSIINIGSTAGDVAPAGGSLYAASKGAINTIVRSLAKELAPRNIRVNGINPGYIITEGVKAAGLAGSDFEQHMIDITPLKRAGRPEEIAAAAAFLASDEASFVTGETLVVSGGAGI